MTVNFFNQSYLLYVDNLIFQRSKNFELYEFVELGEFFIYHIVMADEHFIRKENVHESTFL